MSDTVHTLFRYDPRLDIDVPHLEREWESYDQDLQQEMIVQWERIRAGIPDVIRRFEEEIRALQDRAADEENWNTVCRLYRDIAEYASRINDLNILYRTEPELSLPGNSAHKAGCGD